MHQNRIKKLRKMFKFWEITHFLITNPSDIFYLTGFRGEDSSFLVGKNIAIIYTDGRYTAEVAQICDIKCIETRKKLTDARDKALKTKDAVIAYDGDCLSYSEYLSLKYGVKLKQLKNIFKPTQHLRIVKDAYEIKMMKKATAIAEKAFLLTMAKCDVGTTEKQIAALLEYNMCNLGADKPSFDTIAAIGSNAALPHATPTNRKITKNCLLLMDFGVRYKGYDSDQTRMIAFGKLSKKQKMIIDLVQKSQDAAVLAIKPGAICNEIDAVARGIIDEAGYAKEFKHGTGHGVGIDIHEAPSVGMSTKTILKEGMIITVEPGIYLEGDFGVRLEEMVLVTSCGAKRLTKLPMFVKKQI